MKKLLDNWEIITCTLIALIIISSGAILEYVPSVKETPGGRVVGVFFDSGCYIALALILVSFPKLKNSIEKLASFIKQEQCIFFGTDDRAKCENELIENAKKLCNSQVYYFCYGTNRFGQTLDRLVDLNNSRDCEAKINLVICNPEYELIQNEKDKERLTNNIKWCIDNIRYFDNLMLISPPKLYRACLIKDKKGRMTWAMMQPYSINPHSKTDVLFKTFGKTPILSADIKNGDILNHLSTLITEEFNATMESPQTVKIIEGGKLNHEVDEKWKKILTLA